ncbi:HU family DNA-binding protein [Helicobacter suis]|uniref:HU family DNA-binding protein n=1 Tax=Helicobacter suis TaxID=104628 RepID=UPI0013D0FF76|nr:HU family DNA-binding protein [Helicobacter suis]
MNLVKFGKFEVFLQKGRRWKVPGSDKVYLTKNRYVPKFRPSQTLRDLVARPN